MKETCTVKILASFCLLIALPQAAAADETSVFIAGVHPSQRPAGAPVIVEMAKDGDWYANALHGVLAPYPASLRFLEDQGAWYTPFIHPGMTGPYDIRGWHQGQQ
ncbi:MAG TPA: hypothetical protein ENK80_06260 [Rhodobacterales bacterium]|nr:hypothetical protein [Rhodobacterales bacterium]